MKSFTQLKRDIKVGTTIRTVCNNIKPERNGQVRKVGKVQTNAIAFDIPKEEQKPDFRGEIQTLSWLWWDKASNYEYDGNIFKVYHTDTRTNERVLDIIYEIIGA